MATKTIKAPRANPNGKRDRAARIDSHVAARKASKLQAQTRGEEALRRYATKTGEAGQALADTLEASVDGAKFTPEIVAEAMPHTSDGTRKVYASAFNRPAKVASRIGRDATLEVIRETVAKFGGKDVFGSVNAALAAVLRELPEGSGPVTKAQAAKAVKAGIDRGTGAAKPKGAGKGKGGSKDVDKGMKVAGFADLPPFLAAALTAAGTWECPAGREGARADLIRALGQAHEAAVKLTK